MKATGAEEKNEQWPTMNWRIEKRKSDVRKMHNKKGEQENNAFDTQART